MHIIEAAVATVALGTSQVSIPEIVAITSRMAAMIMTGSNLGEAIEALVDKIGTKTCLEMIDGKIHQKNLETRDVGVIPQITKGMMEEDGTIGEIMKTIGRYRYRGTSVWNKNYSVRGIPVLISASTKIYLLKQPGIKSRVILHL